MNDAVDVSGNAAFQLLPIASHERLAELIMEEAEPFPIDRVLDMGYILHPDEIDEFDWCIVDFPITEIFPPERIDDRIRLDGETATEASMRWRSVRKWMTKSGGAEVAIQQSPIIVKLEGGKVVPLDGWHRCVVAALDYGLTHVRTAVGYDREFGNRIRAELVGEPADDLVP